MRFLFLAHWGIERYSTTERLAHALFFLGHDVLHLVLPRRNPFAAMTYNRRAHPFPSHQPWSPFGRLKSLGAGDVWFAARAADHWLREHPRGPLTIVLQSPSFLPLAREIVATNRVYAALDVIDAVDPTECIAWSTHVFCLSRYQENVLRARYPGSSLRNLGQCGRPADQFIGRKELVPTIAYVGGNHEYLRRDLLAALAALPARLLLIGCDAADASDIFCGSVPDNVTAAGWITGPAFGREVSRAWVGVIPYDPSHPRVVQSNPDKPHDYLMAGLSVVSTPIPELVAMEGITIAAPPEFAGTVERALSGHSTQVAARQRAIGESYSPTRYARRFLDWLSVSP